MTNGTKTKIRFPGFSGGDLRWAYIVSAYLAYVFWLASLLFTNVGGIFLFGMCSTTTFATLWMVKDSISRGRTIPHVMRVYAWQNCVLVLPFYLLWTRGFKGIGWIILNVIALWLIAFLILGRV